ncbi:MAG: ferrochelatase [Bacteroidetes bacterium]|nr:MAG: ferrochelatase [Bacteroidota bacterium]RLD80463.1 MAG: ferrochelatase [Bacteroidota bacterium]
MTQKTAVLLVNLGTPDSASKKNVRKFISEFLNDARVIDIPLILRKLLVNLIIVPFRTPKSAKLYQKLWTDNGSPILTYGISLNKKLNNLLDDKQEAFIAMRYGNPNLKKVLNQIKEKHFSKIVILPLFPQYASSTTGSIVEKIMIIIRKWNYIPEIKIISEFYQHPNFINSWIDQIRKHNIADFDQILFSYHGLPKRHVEITHNKKSCDNLNCKNEINKVNHSCYQAQCYETTRLIAKQLNLDEKNYTVCFQSRFGKKWLSPFTEDIILNEAKKGSKKLLVIPAAFVADCLETVVEIGEDYQDLFVLHDGEKVQMVESLNDNNMWVDTVKEIIFSR